MKTNRSLSTFGALLLTFGFASQALADLPVQVIRVDSGSTVASDLAVPTAPADQVPATTILQMKQSGQDISVLEPTINKIYDPSANPTPDESVFKFDATQSLNYVQPIEGGLAQFWFMAAPANDSSNRLEFMVGENAHNFLLRASLLRRLGYVVPMVQWVPRVTIEFANADAASAFLTAMSDNTFAPADYKDRWIVSQSGTQIVVQDLIVVKGNASALFPNLAGGLVSSQINGQRKLNALSIPFGLVDIPESVNMLPWAAVRVVQNSVTIQHTFADQFNTTFEDAQWITRKIAKLTAADWTAIVSEASLPTEVSMLLSQKLISRRNSLMKPFKVSAPALAVNTNISSKDGKLLKGGKLLLPTNAKTFWPGYGSRFVFGDFEDPFSFSEISAYVESALLGGAIDNAVGAFNSQVLPTTNVPEVLSTKINKLLYGRLVNSLTTGAPFNSNYGLQTVPFISGGVIVSRDLVIGGYMGAENMLQVAESIGLNLGGGFAFNSDALPAPTFLNASAGVSVSRTYTHLIPATGFRESLSQPFRNFLVPLLNYSLASNLNAAAQGINDPKNNDQETSALAENLLNEFTQNFGVGESLIITDSLSPAWSASIGRSMGTELGAEATLFNNDLIVSRTHIYRVSESQIQVYKETGKLGSLSFAISFNAVAQILDIVFPFGTWGHANSKFFNVDIGSPTADRAVLKKNMLALAQLLRTNDTAPLATSVPPYSLSHNFSLDDFQFNFLWIKYTHRDLSHDFTVSVPEGGSKKFLDKFEGSRHGDDYEGLTLSAINGIIELFNPAAGFIPNVSIPESPDPGLSLYGKSNSRTVEIESEVGAGYGLGGDSSLGEFTMQVNYNWKGFEASRKDLDDILSDVTKIAGSDLFPANPLNNTEKARLYRIGISMNVDSEATSRMANLPMDTFAKRLYQPLIDKKIIRFDSVQNKFVAVNPDSDQSNTKEVQANNKLNDIRNAQLAYLKSLTTKNADKITDKALDMLSEFESLFKFKGVAELMGGQGVIISGRIDGVRYGDEDGANNSVISNVYGVDTSKFMAGPWAQLLSTTGMLNSELMLNWLITEF